MADHRRRYEAPKPRGQTYPIPQHITCPPIHKKKQRIIERTLPAKIRELVPESQAYLDLLAFEKKLDTTIMRKRLDIQEALKRPMRIKKKLRIYISHTCFSGLNQPEYNGNIETRMPPCWELRVEGRLLQEETNLGPQPPTLQPNLPGGIKQVPHKKFSSFFKSLVIELDKNLYGPDNHLVEWHRTSHTQETDGFQVKRPGDTDVKCTLLLMLDYQPLQFKLDPRLGRMLAIHTQSRPAIITALWQYIKTHKLQDAHEREYINCDPYLAQIFECPRLKFAEIPQKLNGLLFPPDPIVIHHTIRIDPAVMGPDKRNTACYDIEVEMDDQLKSQMGNFLMSISSQQEITMLDSKIQETIETINNLKVNREFMVRFALDPQNFINEWLRSQSEDLKIMTDTVGNPESERLASYYTEPWINEAVGRYFFNKVQQRRLELEHALGMKE